MCVISFAGVCTGRHTGGDRGRKDVEANRRWKHRHTHGRYYNSVFGGQNAAAAAAVAQTPHTHTTQPWRNSWHLSPVPLPWATNHIYVCHYPVSLFAHANSSRCLPSRRSVGRFVCVCVVSVRAGDYAHAQYPPAHHCHQNEKRTRVLGLFFLGLHFNVEAVCAIYQRCLQKLLHAVEISHASMRHLASQNSIVFFKSKMPLSSPISCAGAHARSH